MSLFMVALLTWYGAQFIEVWYFAGRREYVTGRPLDTTISLFGCSYLFSAVFTESNGLPVSWHGWVLAVYYVINIGVGISNLARGPKREDWNGAAALAATLVLAGIIYLWFGGVLA